MPRGLVVLGVLAVPLIVLELIGKEQKREHRVRGAGRWAGRPEDNTWCMNSAGVIVDPKQS